MMPAADLAIVETALGSDAWLFQVMQRLARGQPAELDAHLHHVAPARPVSGTNSTFRTHYVLCGADGVPRVEPLVRYLTNRVVDYCIPRSRFAEALSYANKTGSGLEIIRLQNEARALFNHLKNSGEGGELLLYILLELALGIPQILCKMSLKTSTAMHVHGADGVHATPTEAGNLAVYWGESKLYENVADAIRECMNSIAPYVTGSAARQDLFLLRNLADLGSMPPGLNDALRAFFCEDDERNSRLEVRGACLVGFSLDDYPDARRADATLASAISANVQRWTDLVARRVKAEALASVHLEVFCVPFPDVEAFRSSLQAAL